jgi:hypothetical protein
MEDKAFILARIFMDNQGMKKYCCILNQAGIINLLTYTR